MARMNDDKIINLKINKRDFEEIYLNGNQGSLFFSPSVKGKFITTVVVAFILVILFFFKDDLSKEKFGILYFVSFLFLLCAVYLSLAINKVSKWKKEVVKYLKTLENTDIYQIQFTAGEISDKFIGLEGKFNYMFPKKSMSEADFELLKEAVQKNVLK
jgi:uncharacterized membrane protein